MKNLFVIILTVTIILTFITPVFAEHSYLIDNADLLSDEFEYKINKKILDFKSRHNADIVIVTTTTLDGKTPRKYADDFYDYNGYASSGVLLLISIEDNDVYISTSGNAITAFTEYGLDAILDEIVSWLSNGDIENGVNSFITISEEYFTLAENGNPYDRNSVPTSVSEYLIIFIIIWVISFLIALVIVSNMKSKLTSIHAQTNANNYVQNKHIELTDSSDIYLYRNISRVRVQSNSGSSTHRSSSGRSHGGGGRKF